MPHGTSHSGGAREGGLEIQHGHHHNFAPHQSYLYRERGGNSYSIGRRSLLQRRPGAIILTLILLLLIIAAVVVLVYYRSALHSSSNIHGNTYLSRDTALVSYTYEFCDKLTMEVSESAAEPSEIATLYLLRSRPSKSQKVLLFNESFSVDKAYKYWMFPLLANSRITLNACVPNYISIAKFYLLRGEGNFNKYKKLKLSADFIKTVSITSCDEGNEVLTNYQVNKDDKYYFIFDNSYYSSDMQVQINIKQELYTVSADTVVSNCSIALKSMNSCSLSVPLSSIYPKALVQVEPNSTEINWDSNHVVNVRCHARAWLIALIIILAALLVALLIAGITGYFVYRRLKQRASDSNIRRIIDSSIDGAEADATVDDVETSAPSAADIAPYEASSEETAPLISSAKPDEDAPSPYNNDLDVMPPYNS